MAPQAIVVPSLHSSAVPLEQVRKVQPPCPAAPAGQIRRHSAPDAQLMSLLALPSKIIVQMLPAPQTHSRSGLQSTEQTVPVPEQSMGHSSVQ